MLINTLIEKAKVRAAIKKKKGEIEKRLAEEGLSSESFFKWYQKEVDALLATMKDPPVSYKLPTKEDEKWTDIRVERWIRMQRNPVKYSYCQGHLFNQE